MDSIEARVDRYRAALEQYDIFDVAAWWAPALQDAFVRYTDWPSEAGAMRKAGIDAALVTSATAAQYDPVIGNDELTALLDGQRGFYGCAVLTPDLFFDPEAGRAYLRTLRERGVVAARIYPGMYRHSTGEFAVGGMLSALEEMGMPLLLWHIDTGWDAIDRICAAHPRLPVILESMDRKLLYHARDYMSLLRAHDNFYMETHNLVLFREIENICALVGSSRLLYGSYFPYMEPNFSIYPIFAADISEQDKQAIYAGNARRLLGV